MDEKKKTQIKTAFTTFVKALIPPTIALISSILTTIVSGDNIAIGTTIGSVTGYVANNIVG